MRSLIEDYRPNEAYAALEEARRQAGDTAEVQTASGLVAIRRGRFAEAEKSFQAAMRLDPKHADAIAGLATIHGVLSRFRSSREFITRAHNTFPDEPRFLAAYAIGLKPRRVHVEALEKALGMLDPDSREAKALRAHAGADRTLGERPVKRLVSPYRRYELPILKSGDRSAIRVSLNGASLKLLLDTGASGLTIHRKAARRSKLEQLESSGAEQRGVGDRTPRTVLTYLARLLRAGDVTFENYSVRVVEGGKIADGDGIIGTDVFQQFLITLDYPAMRIVLEPFAGLSSAPDPEVPWDGLAQPPAPFERFYRLRHLLAVPASINGGPKGLFLVDTGASFHCIDPDAARPHARMTRTRTRVRGIQGQVNEVFHTGTAALEFAGVRDEQSTLVAFELDKLSDSIGCEISGIIGMNGLVRHRITLDYRNGFIRFEPGRRSVASR